MTDAMDVMLETHKKPFLVKRKRFVGYLITSYAGLCEAKAVAEKVHEQDLEDVTVEHARTKEVYLSLTYANSNEE